MRNSLTKEARCAYTDAMQFKRLNNKEREVRMMRSFTNSGLTGGRKIAEQNNRKNNHDITSVDFVRQP